MGVLDRGERDKDNETGLKEGGLIEMSTTVLPYTRCSLLRFEYLRLIPFNGFILLLGLIQKSKIDERIEQM